jgi:hypothetical protein
MGKTNCTQHDHHPRLLLGIRCCKIFAVSGNSISSFVYAQFDSIFVPSSLLLSHLQPWSVLACLTCFLPLQIGGEKQMNRLATLELSYIVHIDMAT